jgi:hypothetical protein
MSRVLEVIGFIVILGTIVTTLLTLANVEGMPPFLLDLAALGVIAAVALLALLVPARS